MTNVESSEMREALRQFFAIKGADPEARLVLWFAGHGYTLGGEWFLVPADAPLPHQARIQGEGAAHA